METPDSPTSLSSHGDFAPAIFGTSKRASIDIGYVSSNAGDDIELNTKAITEFAIPELAYQRPLPPSNSTIFTKRMTPPLEDPSTQNGSLVDITRNTSELAPVDGGFGAWSFVSTLLPIRALLIDHSF